MKKWIIDKLPRSFYLHIKRWKYKFSHPYAFRNSQKMRRTVTEQGYSYKGFDDKKAIFVHIPKCAGISINHQIFGNLGGGHTPLKEYLKVFEPNRIDNYFKFTFVRNPWDRLVSAYYFLKGGGYSQEDSHWFNEELSSYLDFDDFVMNWLNRENIWKWHHFRPQYFYMLDNRSKVSLDFIGYYENLEKDFNYVASKIPLASKLSRTNKSKHKNYMNYYNAETRDLVGNVYREDLNILGYNFDNTSLYQQIAKRDSQLK
ncbi:MAG: sulfotransferase family 2 domain-containing protein [Pseudomonadales bacterium]|nr:sulfotransferase family 2 domain-containing protein [Pseudomonadales bacterium]